MKGRREKENHVNTVAYLKGEPGKNKTNGTTHPFIPHPYNVSVKRMVKEEMPIG